jgi:hypothetical protein
VRHDSATTSPVPSATGFSHHPLPRTAQTETTGVGRTVRRANRAALHLPSWDVPGRQRRGLVYGLLLAFGTTCPDDYLDSLRVVATGDQNMQLCASTVRATARDTKCARFCVTSVETEAVEALASLYPHRRHTSLSWTSPLRPCGCVAARHNAGYHLCFSLQRRAQKPRCSCHTSAAVVASVWRGGKRGVPALGGVQ